MRQGTTIMIILLLVMILLASVVQFVFIAR
jgi:hypothetical protein